MARCSTVPRSVAFDVIALRARFSDVIAIVVNAPPEAIFQALHDVRLHDLKLARLLREC